MKEFLKQYYIHIIVICFVLSSLYTVIETCLICVKDKMTIDYIFGFIDKRKEKKKCDSGTEK